MFKSDITINVDSKSDVNVFFELYVKYENQPKKKIYLDENVWHKNGKNVELSEAIFRTSLKKNCCFILELLVFSDAEHKNLVDCIKFKTDSKKQRTAFDGFTFSFDYVIDIKSVMLNKIYICTSLDKNNRI